jgi:MFS family permease
MTNEPSNPNASVAIGEHDPYSALRFLGFRLYVSGNFLSTMGTQMQTVAVGWEIYRRTQATLTAAQVSLALGLVGLVQVLPVIGLVLLTGHTADRFDRKRIVVVALVAIVLSSLALAAISIGQAPVWTIYLCLLISGVARAFQQPAKASLLTQIVPRPIFPNAVTWGTGSFHLAAALGPAVGGWLIAQFDSFALVYLCDASVTLCFALLLLPVRRLVAAPAYQAATLKTLIAGVEFVWRNKIILGALALDMFAVLLGGAVALLPVYADKILHVGPSGLGCLQAAPAVGALLMALTLAHRAPMERAGWALMWSVTGFGAATILFGFSRWYWLSLAMLFLTGALDNVSVVIRHTLLQLLTPDAMRGRVSAVNSMFIGASNELGRFESGAVAAIFGGGVIGATVSVVSGGMGTLVVVAVLAATVPQLRRYGRLDGSDADSPPLEPPPTPPTATAETVTEHLPAAGI